MKKTLFALLLSTLSIGTCLGAGVQGKNDILDPIYETAPLPENYYVKEESENKIIFANDRVPNMSLSVEFLQSNGKQVYEILADKIYKYRKNNPDDLLQSCQNDLMLKNFASFAFTCIRNQDSTVMVVATQFEDMNNLPSDFYRIMVMSAKSGDSPASDEMGEMINYANYKLGFFENFNIPQKTTLNHHIDDNLKDIDLEGLIKITADRENFWSGPDIAPPVEVENIDITNQGMKFFLKLPTTNEKFLATMHLSEMETIDGIAKQVRNVLAGAYHKCKKPKENSDVDTYTLVSSCSEGSIKVVIKRLPTNKYEFKTYLIITGEESTLEQLFNNQNMNQKLNSYLFKQFYDSEMLHKSNNIFGYMQAIEAGDKIPATMHYVVDKSTAKSLVASQAIPADGKDDKKNSSKPSAVVNKNEYEKEDYKYILIAGACAVAGLLIFLFLAIKKQKIKKQKEEEALREQEELEKHQQENANISLSGESDELLAEIEAERMARRRAAYKNQRDAENLAKELEEKNKNLSEEERNRRKAALENIASQSAPDAIASALSAPKEKVAESNLKANEMIKAQRDEEFSAPAKKAEEPKQPKQSKQEKEKPVVNNEPAAAEEPASSEPQINPEDLTKTDEEIKAEQEKKRQEEERKARSNELLIKMKQAQKSDLAESAQKETKKQPEPVSTKPSVKFTLAGDKPKEKKAETKQEPVVQPKVQSFFASEEMVQPAEAAVQKENQNFFANEEMVQPSEPAVQKESQNFFANEEMVQPAEPAVQKESQNFFANEEMVQPAEPAEKTETQNFFANEEMVQPAVEQTANNQPKMQDFFESEVSAQPIQTAGVSKPKLKDPLEELARKSKKIETAIDEEPEIDLESALGEEINLDMFANDFSTFDHGSQQNTVNSETVLDLSSDDGVLDLSSMTDDSFASQGSKSTDTNRTSEQYADSINLEVERPAEEPVSQTKPKKKTTKKIRKFNLGSISVSLSDKE